MAICRDSDVRQPQIIEPVARLTETEAKAISEYKFQETSFSPYCRYSNETPCRDIWEVDFDNSGPKKRLLKMEADSSAGRGCDAQRFIVLDNRNRPPPNGHQFLPQGFDGYCVKDFSWILSGGHTLLYSRSKDATWSPSLETLSMVSGKNSGVICKARFNGVSRVIFSEH